jgi:hypothetical protein
MTCGTEWKKMALLFHQQTLPVVVIHVPVPALHRLVAAHLLHRELAVRTVVVVVITVMMTTRIGAVMMIKVGAVMMAEAMEIGAVMTVEETTEMIVVMMMVVAVLMVAVLIVSPLLMWTQSVKSARSMATPRMHVGGATRMTRKTGMMVRREQILRHMVLIQIGILIQVPLTTSLVN